MTPAHSPSKLLMSSWVSVSTVLINGPFKGSAGGGCVTVFVSARWAVLSPRAAWTHGASTASILHYGVLSYTKQADPKRYQQDSLTSRGIHSVVFVAPETSRLTWCDLCFLPRIQPKLNLGPGRLGSGSVNSHYIFMSKKCSKMYHFVQFLKYIESIRILKKHTFL